MVLYDGNARDHRDGLPSGPLHCWKPSGGTFRLEGGSTARTGVAHRLSINNPSFNNQAHFGTSFAWFFIL